MMVVVVACYKYVVIKQRLQRESLYGLLAGAGTIELVFRYYHLTTFVVT